MSKRKFPIHAKVTLLIIGAAVGLVSVAMLYFSLVSSGRNEQNYKNIATNLAATASKVVDVNEVNDLKGQVKSIVDASPTHPFSDEWGSPEWEAYIAQFASVEQSASFLKLRSFLRDVEGANSADVDCLYLSYVDVEREAFVYLVDSAEVDPCPPGCLDPLFDVNKDILNDPSKGFPAYITNTAEYGWLVTAGAPIYSGDTVVGYAMVDISMAAVKKNQADSVIRFFAYLAVTAVALGVVAMLVVDLSLIRPLRQLNKAASAYDVHHPENNKNTFEGLTIKNHDEIGELADSILRMEGDVRNKIQELTTAYNDLAQTQRVAAEMTELANKDALTGIRNKTAFDRDAGKINAEIAAGETEPFGIAMIDLNYLKLINDERGHNKGDAALVKLSSLICGIFVHSRVYRVGGDEFVALLKRSDYAHSAALIAEFNEKIQRLHEDEGLPPEDKVSAAIGYAEYIAGKDKSVEEVLSRADKAMYHRKRAMKKADGETTV